MICKIVSLLSFALIPTHLLVAQDGSDTPVAGDYGMWQTVVMIGIAMLFFYFILWRPEQKRRKALEEQRESLKKGDKVTAMGIIGTVHKIKDHTVILKMCDESKIEVLKGAITEVGMSSEPTSSSTAEVPRT